MMNTPARTPAPVTALSSSLSTRISPTIPPASQVYEPLVKSVLARRFAHNVLSVSGAASWVLAGLWTSWQLGGVGSLGIFRGLISWLSPLTLFCAVLWWTLAAVPIAVLRKLYLQPTYAPSLSPRETLVQRIKERRYQLAFVVILASSGCLTACHAMMAQTIEKYNRGDPKLGIWAGSKKHPYHLNGRLCFLFLSQTICASIYWLREVLKNRFSIRWSNKLDLFVHAFPILYSSLISMLMLSAVSTASTLTIFALLRSIALPVLYRLPIIHSFLRPFVAHFLRPTYTITFFWSHFDMIIRAFLFSLSTYVLWEIPSAMFDAAFSIPSPVSDALKDAGLILVAGINSTDAYFQLHAFHDLTLLSADSDQMAAKRAVIYNDMKHNPTLWAALVRRCLLLLGADYQLFLRRGNPPPSPKAPEPPKPKPVVVPAKPSTPIIRTQIHKTQQGTPVDQLADALSSDSPIVGMLSQSSNNIELPDLLKKSVRTQIDAIQGKMRVANVNVTMPGAVTSSISSVTRFVSIYSSHWPRALDLGVWWTRARRDRAAQRALPNKEMDVMIVEVLSKMVARSLKEDQMGFVQRDIPRVLEALVSFLYAVEDYQRELASFVATKESEASADSGGLITLKEESARASEWVEELSEGLRTGISLIVRTFGDSLSKYRFAPKVAAKLQSFADYI